MTTTTIETKGLSRSFGDFVALHPLDLAIREGEIFGYLGLNGAGKTTTIRMLSTLLRPTAGEARVAGHDVAREPVAVRASIGLVGDEGASRPSWTARELVGTIARLHGVADARAATERALDRVALAPAWRGRAIAALSTGMRRRVEIARALVGAPRVLFLDEPSRGLDLPAKRETWDLLRSLAAEERVTIFLSSHEAGEIQALCGSLAVLHAGRVAFRGRASDLGSDPARFEAALVALLDGRAREAKPSIPGAR